MWVFQTFSEMSKIFTLLTDWCIFMSSFDSVASRDLSFKATAFWFLTPCSLVHGYQYLEDPVISTLCSSLFCTE